MTLVAAEIDLSLDGFHPGFLDTPDVDKLPLGATPDARNSLFVRVQKPDDGGPRANLRKRLGSRLLNTSALASERSVDGLFAFPREVGAEELLAVCNGVLERWNNINDFAPITAGGVFTPGARVTTLAFKNNLIVMDGHVNRRYDGSSAFTLGFVAPTSAPGLVAGPAVGPTGTYEGYAVWYDSVMDHESSPSATTPQVVISNTKRHWTKPAGAPPAQVDFWRVYCRRVDTSENSFFRVATVAIGLASFEEAIVDAARRDRGPTDNENDVPPAFAFAEEYKGYRLGFKLDSSDMYASKLLDPESQHPKDVFPVGGKGDTKPVRSAKKYATECLIRKPTRTYRLVGDRVPFKIEPIQSSLGGVSQKSGTEVEDWWYDWDEVKGPYRTNTVQWEPLGDHRITRVLATVNQQALTAIECVHYKTLNLIVWKIPVGGTTRCRMLLKYHYGLQRWLDPDTGFEYTAMTEFTTTAGAYGVYFGDEWGRVYQLYNGEIDGVPSGTHTVAITAATSGSITAGTAAFFTGGDGLAGMPALALSPTGDEQWVRVRSNTGTLLTLDVANGPQLNPVPTAGWTVIVGGIDWYWWTSWLTAREAMRAKSAGWFWLSAATSAAAHVVRLDCRVNRASAILRRYNFTFQADGLVWGVGQWGDLWGAGATTHERKHRMPQAFMSVQFRFANFYPEQPVEITRFRLTADWLRRRVARSA